MARPLLGELLVSAKVITHEKLEDALTNRVPGRKIGQELLARGLITEAQLTQTLSLQLGVPWVSLYHIDFSRALLNRVPEELAERHCLVPIFVRSVKGQGDTLYLATDDPKNEAALAEVSKAAALPTRPMIASPSDIKSAIRVYYGDDGEGENTPLPVHTEASAPPTRVDGAGVPSTSRDGRPRSQGMPSSPMAQSVPQQQIAPAPGAYPPPPPGPPPAPPPLPPQANSGSSPAPAPTSGSQPPSRRSSIPPRPSDPDVPRDGAARMVALTLLDGTQIQLPARSKKRGQSMPPSAGGISEALTARDLVSALRAVSHGADASEILGDAPQWEPVIAALLSILLRKGLIADWEFIDEYRKI